jgi:hypothetical protein
VFSRARHERFRQSDALRQVFESVVAKCIAVDLVGGEGFSIDASLIRADVDKKKWTPGDQPINWPKAEEASSAVSEYLTALDAAQKRPENSEDDDKFGGGSRRKPPKEVSLTDPQAAWVARLDMKFGDRRLNGRLSGRRFKNANLLGFAVADGADLPLPHHSFFVMAHI